MYIEFAKRVCEILSTDQSHYAEQQIDGSYRKKAGVVSCEFIVNELKNEGSIAIYQKNTDLTIKWICFDFDILKKCLDSDLRNKANEALDKTVILFCQALEKLNITFLLEFSGNRGFHVWITFDEAINFRTGYDIQQAIVNKIELNIDSELIGLDLFPHSATPTSGVGLGVKMPLSKHKKSGAYSYLLSNIEDVNNIQKHVSLSGDLLNDNVAVLAGHRSTSKSEIERNLGVFFESYRTDETLHNRIKNIKVQRGGFSLADLLSLWDGSKPLEILSKKIKNNINLSHSERKLVVGILCNVICKSSATLSDDILHEIFRKMENYDNTITNMAIQSLRNFNFPTQEQIESILLCKFEVDLSLEELVALCIPKYLEYTDAIFEFSHRDIEIVRAAEINYLFMNDEVQSKIIVEELSSKDSEEYLLGIDRFIGGDKNWGYYKHIRNEGGKTRELVTLNSDARVATTCILKQLSYYFDLKLDENSHGYQINKGFSDGYIFKPWLYLWLKFISNITEAIEEPVFKDYYIVKTDIKGFYDNIPHDNLKRMLLGDGVTPVKDKVTSMREETSNRYRMCLDSIFNLTEDIVGEKKGLPQGPAYARYFAEIYLAGIDKGFRAKLVDGTVLLYQRYVDDIFFITKTKSSAKKIFEELKADLALLNLTVNNDKTLISNIARFHGDFNKYRAQSKYSVDQISKRYMISSEKQKSMAINEFVTLVQSDSCQDDLSFIFSHLEGVKELNDLKTEQVKPALISRVGRGSLFKNLFNFILELNDGWEVIFDIEKYDVLQSEVLTACLISAIEVNKVNREKLIKIVGVVEPLLSYSAVVSEHMAYMITSYGCSVNVTKVEQRFYISALKAVSDYRTIHVTSELLAHLNLSINELKSLTIFIKIMYAFCYNNNISEVELNDLSSLFYAKMTVEESAGKFSLINAGDAGISDPLTANKFYYLLCIFSVSNRNKSTDLIESMWKFCARLYNDLEHSNVKFSAPNWLDKLKLVEFDNSIVNWIISSIVDGNIFRGASDEKRIFERFHNTLLVYLSLDGGQWKSISISDKLKALKAKSKFYNWLIDNDGVSIFPASNKKWFERNIIENGVISLKKGEQVLLRKPNSEFICKQELLHNSNGFSELIVNHQNVKLTSFRDYIGGLDLADKFAVLMKLVSEIIDTNIYPSIYCPDRVVAIDDQSLFSTDFFYQSKLICDDEYGNVISYDNSVANFIRCFLDYISENDDRAKVFYEKYFNNLDESVDKYTFICKFYSQILGFEDGADLFYFDVAISSALYLSQGDLEPIKRIDNFISQYSKFYNDDNEKHIFAVKEDMSIDDGTPCLLFDSIIFSLKLVVEQSVKSLPFYLYDDIEKYKSIVTDLVFNSSLGNSGVVLDDFKLSDISVLSLSRELKINGGRFVFDNIKIINPLIKEICNFELRHTALINSSDHIFTHIKGGNVYIFAANSFISVIYAIVQNRYRLLIEVGGAKYSYPLSLSSEDEISALNGFDVARTVMQHHRNITAIQAGRILINWLSRLPKEFHQPLVTLIEAHEVMRKNELDNFVNKVKDLDAAGENLFLIKKVEDFNGTHRILYRDNGIGRDIASFTPVSLDSNCKEVTLVTDVIITGSQILRALGYYIEGGNFQPRSNHFECTEEQHEKLLKLFSGVDVINICTVLYTFGAIEKVQQELRRMLNNEITLKIVNGRDISSNAFFGSTTNISESNKVSIRKLLRNPKRLSSLFDHLSYQGKPMSFNSDSEIDEMNLVARYCSLPKKSFDFLRSGLKSDPNCKPLNRVLELTDK